MFFPLSGMANVTCLENEFQCKNGHCIALHWQCDNEADCKDNSDEDPKICRKLNVFAKSCGGISLAYSVFVRFNPPESRRNDAHIPDVNTGSRRLSEQSLRSVRA